MVGDQSDRGKTVIPSHHYTIWDSELQFITSRDKHHLRLAYSDRQRTRLLNWIDEIKLSEKSGSKIRDHLNLDDQNLFNERNSKLKPEDAELDEKIVWTKLQSRIRYQQENEEKEVPAWVDELFLRREEYENLQTMDPGMETPGIQPQHPATFPNQNSQSITEETQDGWENIVT